MDEGINHHNPMPLFALVLALIVASVATCSAVPSPSDPDSVSFFQVEVHAFGIVWGPYHRIRVDPKQVVIHQVIGTKLINVGSIFLTKDQANRLNEAT